MVKSPSPVRVGVPLAAAVARTGSSAIRDLLEITERPEIRREIVKVYDAACAKLGVEPRPHD